MRKDYNFCILVSIVWGLGAHYLPAAQRANQGEVDLQSLGAEIFEHLETVLRAGRFSLYWSVRQKRESRVPDRTRHIVLCLKLKAASNTEHSCLE